MLLLPLIYFLISITAVYGFNFDAENVQILSGDFEKDNHFGYSVLLQASEEGARFQKQKLNEYSSLYNQVFLVYL